MTKEKEKVFNIILLTPCFCVGAKNKEPNRVPEIRGASIRGMIREWIKLLGGNPDLIWGGKGGNASKVSIRISNINNYKESREPILPHKGGTSQLAIFPKTTFDLVMNRLVGCTEKLWEEAKQDVENWLLLGCLGQRANRAAGSVWNTNWKFCSINDFFQQSKILDSFDIYISEDGFECASEVREIASDTVNNIKYFGSFNPRTPSPTKMKVIKIADKFHLLLFSNKRNILDGAIRELKNKHDPHRWKNLNFISNL